MSEVEKLRYWSTPAAADSSPYSATRPSENNLLPQAPKAPTKKLALVSAAVVFIKLQLFQCESIRWILNSFENFNYFVNKYLRSLHHEVVRMLMPSL